MLRISMSIHRYLTQMSLNYSNNGNFSITVVLTQQISKKNNKNKPESEKTWQFNLSFDYYNYYK